MNSSNSTTSLFLAGLMTVVLAVAPANPARAHSAAAPMDNQISSVTSVETWLTTETARVTISAELGVGPEGLRPARTDTARALKQLDGQADWRYSGLTRQGAQAGLERWRLTAEARLASEKLADLHTTLKSASRPGMSLTVARIDHSPSRAERRGARAKLRQQIYKLALEERERVNAVFTERRYRIGAIDFLDLDGSRPQPRLMRSAAQGVRAIAAKSEPPVARLEKLAAQITLLAIAAKR